MTGEDRRRGPGFQGSETSTVEIVAYSHGDDPILRQKKEGKIEFTAKHSWDSGEEHIAAIVGVSTTKAMGGASGTWSFSVKVPQDYRLDFRSLLADDDWVDVSFKKWGRVYHTMRGPIDGVRRQRSVNANGAMVTTYVISGRDHGKVFEQTKVWFNNFTGENAFGGATLRAAASSGAIFGESGIEQVVDAYLFGFLRALGEFGRSLWTMPPGMPNMESGAAFVDVVNYSVGDKLDDPPRRAINPNMVEVNGNNLWALAQEWSDPQFVELYCDLLDSEGNIPRPDTELPPDESQMGVILRPRPFPTAASLEAINEDRAITEELSLFGEAGQAEALQRTLNADAARLKESEWFSLPVAIVERQEIAAGADIGRSGEERVNALIVSPAMLQELVGKDVELQAPLLDRESIARHGVRKLDYYTNYIATDGNDSDVAKMQREKLMDWFALNPYFYNGNLPLGHGRPDIRIGTKILIPGQEGPDPTAFDEVYYVEGVSHTWEPAPVGMRTTLTVTRGWLGGDRGLIRAHWDVRKEYKTAKRADVGIIAGEPIDTGTEFA
jgi:hypothetical protein